MAAEAAGGRTEPIGAAVTEPSGRTVRHAVEEYLATHPKATEAKKGQMRVVAHDLGKIRIADLTFDVVQRYIRLLEKTPVPPPRHKKKPGGRKAKTGIVKCYAGSTIRKYFYALKQAVKNDVRRHGHKLEDGLFDSREHELPGHWDNPRERRLSPGEEPRILEACEEGVHGRQLRLLVELELATGARLQEIALAEWGDLVQGGKGLRVPAERCKTRTARTIPLSSAARAVIEALRPTNAAPSDPVFPAFNPDKGAASTSFARAAKRAGIKNLTFHDLRHEALSRLCELGTLNLMELMKISGHSDPRTLERYIALLPDDLADKLG